MNILRSHCFEEMIGDPLDGPSITVAPNCRSGALYEVAKEHFHGYSSQTKLFPVAFSFGSNEILVDVDGNRYVDLTSGTYCAGLGHGNRYIAHAIYQQALRLSNTHSWLVEKKVNVAKRLAQHLPEGLNQLEFYCEGTVAVEAALRLVRLASDGPIVTFDGSFHGKTIGSATLTDRKSSGKGFAYPFEVVRLPWPEREESLWNWRKRVRERTKSDLPEVGSIFVEPIQGVAGIRVPPDWFLPTLRGDCDQKKALLVVDEIFTGFGRSGEMWVSTVKPDILLFGKIAGGGMPLSGLATTEEVANHLNGSSVTTTYGANPLSFAACGAVLTLLSDPDLKRNIKAIGLEIKTVLKDLQLRDFVCQVGGVGCMWGCLFPTKELGERIFIKLGQRGVLTQIEGQVCRLAPPLTARPEVIAKAMQIFSEVVIETTAFA